MSCADGTRVICRLLIQLNLLFQPIFALRVGRTRGTTGGTSCESPPLKEGQELISIDKSISIAISLP